MSGLKDISNSIKKVYDSDSGGINESLNLLLSKASRYSRIGSYFSSKSFISLAEGLNSFVQQGGKMRLIINYQLNKEDYEALKKTIDYGKLGEKILVDIQNLKSEIELNSAKVLGWLISEGKLEIRVVTGESDKLMHIKQGIIEDDFANKVAFTGSANETYSAYEKNIEEVTFFKNWEGDQEEYVDEFLFRFDHFWHDYGKEARTYSLSKAFEKGLIKIRPKSKTELQEVLGKILQKKQGHPKAPITPRPYQKEALDLWVKNGRKGIIEMPTGCGKTKTAIFCYKTLEQFKPLITLVFAPTIAICDQWKEEFENEECEICKIYDNPSWKSVLKKNIVNTKLGTTNRLMIIGTYALINSPYLIGQMRKTQDIKKMLIADEVHSTGATKISEGLIENYEFRLGLSATPKRWLDEEGTNKVFEYFGGVVYNKLSLYDAIYKLDVLSEYDYNIIHVTLNDEEQERYFLLTKRIIQKSSMKEKDPYNKALDSEIQRLLEKRAKIIKDCAEKIEKLPEIIDQISEEKSIIFVSPNQRKKVLEIVKPKIKYHQYTFSEKTGIRQEILENFRAGKIGCIIAIKCLDEGLDVPWATVGVIMASSGNPREFIQRRGRLLRKDESKEYAKIYDFFVTPQAKVLESSELYKNQIEKELSRIAEFAKSARNELELAKELKELKTRLNI